MRHINSSVRDGSGNEEIPPDRIIPRKDTGPLQPAPIPNGRGRIQPFI